MRLAEHQHRLDSLLAAFHPLWHAQPFHKIRPAWCSAWPGLTAELLALDDRQEAQLAADDALATAFVARHIPQLAELPDLVRLAERPASPLPDCGQFWAWGIPGRKRAQIEAFAAASRCSSRPVIDWCGGKGHLGRLLALHWAQGVTTLEIDGRLCADGEKLAERAGAQQRFVTADVMQPVSCLQPGRHAVALHACGDLHRTLVANAAKHGLEALDLAPCCYYRGLEGYYAPLSGVLGKRLTAEDARLAVTELVTAAPRQARQRDREMAWKLGFDAWRRQASGVDAYRNFRPVPPAWMRGDFAGLMLKLCAREGLPMPGAQQLAQLEQRGEVRRREVMRLSILRHVFRRPLEIWLALDLALRLENDGYAVSLGRFCERRLTPRNLLISARRR